MKIGVVSRSDSEDKKSSPSVFVSNIIERLPEYGIETTKIRGTSNSLKSFDIVWDPFVSSGRTPSCILDNEHIPSVVTVHGSGPHSLSLRNRIGKRSIGIKGNIRLYINYLKWVYKWVKNIDCIVTVSGYAKKDISKNLSLPPNMVRVIYHGVDDSLFSPEGSKKYDDRYYLHVSSGSPPKNIRRIVEAYESIDKHRRPKLFIVCNKELSLGSVDGVEVIGGGIEHEKLAPYYRGAMALLLPSTKETFGLPILEAMACGCPVVTSCRAACPEVAAPAALFAEPTSVEDIASCMEEILQNKVRREEMGRRGARVAKNWDWDIAARKYSLVFKNIL
ncbi:glycosyltransferase involved in cell wall biosynthesis [Salinibacter ruber]|uniref:glycosyltransferase family 4 protein n=1 Tax=Salinibacter ruber TaxID=146919 RepID=UPI0021687C45|nr:glycosyltransferase family 1 protein [Salinibacter ruber]MCS3628940.1 glycosyltransferase involved in cell wall biosynthesis [Salinibacter ruber]MCS4145849.1 glycosyltransferase involved in cell wall biosynthesis [Salinibacter ruber]